MKYLTNEWYELCQRTGLHFGMKVHSGAYELDEALFQRTYERKEQAYVKVQQEMYDTDPRAMLKHNGEVLTRADAFFCGEEVTEEHQIVYSMPPEERAHIEKLIAAYDARPPFDEKKCQEEYKEMMEWNYKQQAERLPQEIYDRIADIRLFTLGYCTRGIVRQLKKQSKRNEEQMQLVLKEYREVNVAQDIPVEVRRRLHFHDCTVTELVTGDELVIRFDTRGGFTNINKFTLVAPEIIKQEGDIVGRYWLYEELYRIDDGYELHILFEGKGMPELIVRCKDILVEIE